MTFFYLFVNSDNIQFKSVILSKNSKMKIEQ